MHERPSVTYEDSYKRRGRPWDKGRFTLLLDGWDYVRVVTTRYNDFGKEEDFKEGTLEPKSALLYQLLHSSLVQPHCSSGVHGEGEYPRSRLRGQWWVIAFGLSMLTFKLGVDLQQRREISSKSSWSSSPCERYLCCYNIILYEFIMV